MAEINIRLIYNLDSGKKDIFIDFESESDALPVEHENAHRDIVQQLIGQNLITEDEAGEVVISRVEPQANQEPRSKEPELPEQQSANN